MMIEWVEIAGFGAFGPKRRIGLSRRTALVGKETSGKTTILKALAILNEGRSWPGSYAHDDVKTMLAAMASGREVRCEGEKTLKFLTAPGLGYSNPPAPLSASAQKTREAVLRRFGSLSEAPEPAHMSDDQRALWMEIMQDAPKNPMDALAHASSKIQALKPKLTGEINALERVLPKMGEPKAGDARRRKEIVEQLEHISDPKTPEVEAAQEALNKARRKLRDSKAKLELGRSILGLARQMAAKGGMMPCPVCGVPGSGLSIVDHLSPIVAKRAAVVDALQTQVRDAELKWQDATHRAESAIRGVKSKLIAELNEINSRAATSSNRIDVEADLARARNRRLALDGLGAEVRRLITAATREAIEQASAEVSKFMPPSRSARLVISDDGKVFRWAIGGKEDVTGQSGGEVASLVVAIRLAWGSRTVFLDDGDLTGMSSRTVHALLTRLGNLQEAGDIEQIIVTRHDDREDEIPNGWDVVYCGAQ